MFTDIENKIIQRHHVNCRTRCMMEIKIVRLILDLAKKAGYSIQIAESEGDENFPTLLENIFDLDDCHLLLNKDKKQIGWIRLVFGNDGFDLVSDYTVNLEEFLKPVNELADKLENGHYDLEVR